MPHHRSPAREDRQVPGSPRTGVGVVASPRHPTAERGALGGGAPWVREGREPRGPSAPRPVNHPEAPGAGSRPRCAARLTLLGAAGARGGGAGRRLRPRVPSLPRASRRLGPVRVGRGPDRRRRAYGGQAAISPNQLLFLRTWRASTSAE